VNNIKKSLKLFLEFLKLGCFTFGGGWSIVAQIQQTYIEKRREMSADELLDLVSVGRSLPGTMVGNVALLFGYHMAGIWGALACLFGLIIPPFAVMYAITFCYTLLQDNIWMEAAMIGVRAAVAPIIAGAIIGMVKSAFRLPPCYVVAVLAFVLYLFFDVSCVLLVIIGAVCGLIICEIDERREAKKHGAA